RRALGARPRETGGACTARFGNGADDDHGDTPLGPPARAGAARGGRAWNSWDSSQNHRPLRLSTKCQTPLGGVPMVTYVASRCLPPVRTRARIALRAFRDESMDRLGPEIDSELARFGPQAGMAELVERWPAVVGPAIARNAWPARIARDGTVHVNTADS